MFQDEAGCSFVYMNFFLNYTDITHMSTAGAAMKMLIMSKKSKGGAIFQMNNAANVNTTLYESNNNQAQEVGKFQSTGAKSRCVGGNTVTHIDRLNSTYESVPDVRIRATREDLKKGYTEISKAAYQKMVEIYLTGVARDIGKGKCARMPVVGTLGVRSRKRHGKKSFRRRVVLQSTPLTQLLSQKAKRGNKS